MVVRGSYADAFGSTGGELAEFPLVKICRLELRLESFLKKLSDGSIVRANAFRPTHERERAYKWMSQS